MRGTMVMSFDADQPIPDLSVVELAIVICCIRKPGIDLASVALNIGRWFGTSVVESDLLVPLRRLEHRAWLTSDGSLLHPGQEAQKQAEFAARGIVRLLFRDRYFFDVARLLSVKLVREDLSDED
jgi:hypothetical protein